MYGLIILRISVSQQSLTFNWKVLEVKINSVGLHVHVLAYNCSCMGVSMGHHSYRLCNSTQCYAIGEFEVYSTATEVCTHVLTIDCSRYLSLRCWCFILSGVCM